MKALVTGGTGGIGKDRALSLLKRGYEVRVVSRKEGEFRFLGFSTRKFRIKK